MTGVGPHQERGVGPSAHEGFVVPASLEHHVDQPKRRRRVRAGPHLQPVLGLTGESCAARVDHHEPGSAVHRVDGRRGVHQTGHRRVVAPVEDAAGALEVRHEGPWDRCAEGVDRRHVPTPAAQLHRAGEVRAAERPTQPHDPVHRVAQRRGRGRRRPEHHRLWTAVVGDLPKPGGDGVQCLVPADLLPTRVVRSLRTGPAKRMEQPVGMLEDAGCRLALHTHGTTCRMSRIRPDRGEPTFHDGGRRTASRHTHRTERRQLISTSTGHRASTKLGSIPLQHCRSDAGAPRPKDVRRPRIGSALQPGLLKCAAIHRVGPS